MFDCTFIQLCSFNCRQCAVSNGEMTVDDNLESSGVVQWALWLYSNRSHAFTDLVEKFLQTHYKAVISPGNRLTTDYLHPLWLVFDPLSSAQVFQHLKRLCILLCTWCHRLSNIFVVVLIVLIIKICNFIALQTLVVSSRKFNAIHCFNDQFWSIKIYLINNEEKFYLHINESVGPIKMYLLHSRVCNT